MDSDNSQAKTRKYIGLIVVFVLGILAGLLFDSFSPNKSLQKHYSLFTKQTAYIDNAIVVTVDANTIRLLTQDNQSEVFPLRAPRILDGSLEKAVEAPLVPLSIVRQNYKIRAFLELIDGRYYVTQMIILSKK